MSLVEKKCVPCEGGSQPLTAPQVAELLLQTPGWEADDAKKSISRLFTLGSYWETIGFVNAVAWISQGENHHPDMEVGYKKVRVRYSTHAVGGLSENDFICAAKVSRLKP